jgi:hypothetical protein
MNMVKVITDDGDSIWINPAYIMEAWLSEDGKFWHVRALSFPRRVFDDEEPQSQFLVGYMVRARDWHPVHGLLEAPDVETA